jgi:hypothetical protein
MTADPAGPYDRWLEEFMGNRAGFEVVKAGNIHAVFSRHADTQYEWVEERSTRTGNRVVRRFQTRRRNRK